MDATRISVPSPRWLWIAAIWSGVGLIDATQTVFSMRSQGMHHAWVQLFVTLTLSWLPWALATPLIIGLGRRYPPARAPAFLTWCVHLGTVAAIGLIGAAWVALLEVLLNPWAQPQGPGPFMAIWLPKFRYGFVISLILYTFVLAVSLALDLRERVARQRTASAQLNEQLSAAQLNALRRQIEPHFMFNTLNAIAGLVRDNRNDAAVSMIVGLSEFLRRALEDSNRLQVPLQQEVEHLHKYLEIQQVRFSDRLQVSMDFPASVLPAQVPCLILQPLVENAIKHGISKRAQGGSIRIEGFRCNDSLHLSVYNEGPSLPADWEKTPAGIGIANLRTRLQLQFGVDFTLSLRKESTGGVQVLVTMPFRET